ncbi:MAG TPA: tetratricopeptide repeat protein [Candidatus Acidoferrales bacterium]|nr:tetratricopeptide repeat protein [Candidatus Acidoferrales bacterium]
MLVRVGPRVGAGVFRLCLAAVLGLLWTMLSPALALAAARITVVLLVGEGAPFDGTAIVSVARAGGELVGSGSVTSGRTVFSGLSEGSYSVSADAPGYRPESREVEILPMTGDAEVDITLRPVPNSQVQTAPAGAPILSPKLKKELTKTIDALRTNDLREAQKHMEAALTLGPGNPGVHFVHGLVLERAGDLAGARASWERTLSLDPKHIPSLLSLSELLLRQGQLLDAKTHLQGVLQLDPKSWRAYGLLAFVYLHQRAYPDAISAATQSLQLGKDQVESMRLVLGEAYIAQGQYQKAKESVLAFLKSNPSGPPLNSARHLLELAERKESASNSQQP